MARDPETMVISAYNYHLTAKEPHILQLNGTQKTLGIGRDISLSHNFSYRDYLRGLPAEKGIWVEFRREAPIILAMAMDMNSTLGAMANPQPHDMPHFILCQEHFTHHYDEILTLVGQMVGLKGSKLNRWLHATVGLNPMAPQGPSKYHIHNSEDDLKLKATVLQYLRTKPNVTAFFKRIREAEMGGFCELPWEEARRRWFDYFERLAFPNLKWPEVTFLRNAPAEALLDRKAKCNRHEIIADSV